MDQSPVLMLLVLLLCMLVNSLLPSLHENYGVPPAGHLPALWSMEALVLVIYLTAGCVATFSSVNNYRKRLPKTGVLSTLLTPLSKGLLRSSEKRYPHDVWIVWYTILKDVYTSVIVLLLAPRATIALALVCGGYSNAIILFMSSYVLVMTVYLCFLFFVATPNVSQQRWSQYAVTLLMVVLHLGLLYVIPERWLGWILSFAQARLATAAEGIRLLARLISGWLPFLRLEAMFEFGVRGIAYALALIPWNLVKSVPPVCAVINLCVFVWVVTERKAYRPLQQTFFCSVVYIILRVLFGWSESPSSPYGVIQTVHGLLVVLSAVRTVTLTVFGSAGWTTKFHPAVLATPLLFVTLFQFRSLAPAVSLLSWLGMAVKFLGLVPATTPAGTVVGMAFSAMMVPLILEGRDPYTFGMPSFATDTLPVITVASVFGYLWLGWWVLLFRIGLGIVHAYIVPPAYTFNWSMYERLLSGDKKAN